MQLSIDEPCLLFAIERESRAFRREFPPQQRFPKAPCLARFCGPSWLTVLAMETGVGSANMRTALGWLLDKPKWGELAYQPKVVLAAGFAGALKEGISVGDIVLATEIVDTDGKVWPVTWPDKPLTGDWQPPIRRDRVLSSPKLIGSPREKKWLGNKHHALTVDMESAAAAEMCSQAGIPFGCVRVVSDDVHTPLSAKLASLISGSKISAWRSVLALFTNPALIPQIWRLSNQTRIASEKLGSALGELLTLTLPWSDELETK